ncbi:hypothetical protein [Gluconobacter cerinus]|uniref:hypothetical protein n=1 Tax=Gluconobacter cerinus TaxID=38307 RepID=UPI000C0806D2|nr:hypothetical protein [Gluconobacter cerinus]
MPIRQELKALYPPNWPELSRQVRFERAGGMCQRCGRPHGQILQVLPGGRWKHPETGHWFNGRGRPVAPPDLIALLQTRQTKVVLAAAHLNHDPTVNRLRNLRALCQRCHLLHDRVYHLAQRRLTFRRRLALGDFFEGPYRIGVTLDETGTG